MDDNQENRFTAALEVQDFLEDNATALEVLPQIAVAKGELDEHIEKYVEAEGLASTNYTGPAEDKAIQRAALISATLRLSRGAKALATDTGDTKLLRKVDLVKTDLSKLRDTQLYIDCKQLNKIIAPLIPSLAPYLVLPVHLTDQEDALDAYFDAIPEPADQTDERRLAGEEVDRRLSLIYELFNKKLDTYMDLLVDDEPALVAEYYLARAIDDNAGGGSNASGNGDGNTNGNTEGNAAGNQPIVFSGTIGPMITQATGTFTYKATMSVKIQVSAAMSLSFQLAQNGMAVGNPKTIAGNTEQTFTITEFHSGGDVFLISNMSAQTGGYTITLN